MAAQNSSFELEAVEVALVNKNACRKRKPNFSVQEIVVITQKFEENQAILISKFTNTSTNKLKQSVWEEMTIAVNAVRTAHRSIAEVNEKWTNLQRTAQHPQVLHANKSSGRKSHQMMCFACSMKRCSEKRKPCF